MVVDCGGGTVDITVYQMTHSSLGLLKEIYKASGGPYGSIGKYLVKYIPMPSRGLTFSSI